MSVLRVIFSFVSNYNSHCAPRLLPLKINGGIDLSGTKVGSGACALLRNQRPIEHMPQGQNVDSKNNSLDARKDNAMPDIFSILGGISSGLTIAEKAGEAIQQYKDGEIIAAGKYLDSEAYAASHRKELQHVPISRREAYLRNVKKYEDTTRKMASEAAQRQQNARRECR